MAIYSWESGNDKPIDRATLKELLIKYKKSALFSSELIDYFEALINNEINYIKDYSTCCSKMDDKLEEFNLNFYDQIITSNIYYMILSFFKQYSNINNLCNKCEDGQFYCGYNNLLLITFSRQIDNNLINFINMKVIDKLKHNNYKLQQEGIFRMFEISEEKTNKEKYIINIERYDTISLLKQKIQQLEKETIKKYTQTWSNEFDNDSRRLLVRIFKIYNDLAYDKLKEISQRYHKLDNWSFLKPYKDMYKDISNMNMSIDDFNTVFTMLNEDCEKILKYYEKNDKCQLKENFTNDVKSAFLEYIGLNENDFKKTSDSTEQKEKSSINIGKKLILNNITNKYLDE